VFRWARSPVKTIEAEAHHLHDVEQAGSSGKAPFIAILGVFLFVVPIAAFMMIVAFSAYSLAR
jgi:hypothetical protein